MHVPFPFPLTILAILLALLVYLGLGFVVGKARATYDVPAPASSGHPEFDKRNRVHINTLEQLALFLPAIFLAAPVFGDTITALFGLVFSAGRIVYARSYYSDPKTRSLGYVLTVVPVLVLIIAAGWGAVRMMIA